MVLASSCRIESLAEKENGSVVEIETTSPAGIVASSLIKLVNRPAEILADGVPVENVRWDDESKTIFFQFSSSGKAVVQIKK